MKRLAIFVSCTLCFVYFAASINADTSIEYANSNSFQKFIADKLQTAGFSNSAELASKAVIFYQPRVVNVSIEEAVPAVGFRSRYNYPERTYDLSLLRFLIPIQYPVTPIGGPSWLPQFISINFGLDGLNESITLLKVIVSPRNSHEFISGYDILNRINELEIYGSNEEYAATVPVTYGRSEIKEVSMADALAYLIRHLNSEKRPTVGFYPWLSPLTGSKEGREHYQNIFGKFKSGDPIYNFRGIDTDLNGLLRQNSTRIRKGGWTRLIPLLKGLDLLSEKFFLTETEGILFRRVTLPSLPEPLGNGVFFNPEFLSLYGLNPKNCKSKLVGLVESK